MPSKKNPGVQRWYVKRDGYYLVSTEKALHGDGIEGGAYTADRAKAKMFTGSWLASEAADKIGGTVHRTTIVPVLAKLGDKLTFRSQYLHGLPTITIREVAKVRRYPRWQTLSFAFGQPVDQMLGTGGLPPGVTMYEPADDEQIRQVAAANKVNNLLHHRADRLLALTTDELEALAVKLATIDPPSKET